MKALITKFLPVIGIVISAIAFVGAQGSYLFWHQPRAPRHLKKL